MSYSRWSNSPWYTFWHCYESADGQPQFAAWLNRVAVTPILTLNQVAEAMDTHDWRALGHEITDAERGELEKLAGYWLADVARKEEYGAAADLTGCAWVADNHGWRRATQHQPRQRRGEASNP